jgi:hypothetical protein
MSHLGKWNTSLFEDFKTNTAGWLGPAMCPVVELESSGGIVGIGTAGAFHGGPRSFIADYYAPLL